MHQSPLLSGGPVEFCATAPSTHARYMVTALCDRMRTEALALRELPMFHRRTSIETLFPEAPWVRRDGSDADCLGSRRMVTIDHLPIASYPEGGLAGRALTDTMPLCRLDGGLDAGIHVMACTR